MAQPWVNSRTHTLYLRQRVPRDVLDDVRGKTVRLPIGSETQVVNISDMVQVSLQTKDATEAKLRHAAADAALRRHWDRVREIRKLRDERKNGAETFDFAGSIQKSRSHQPMDWDRAMQIYGAAAEQSLVQQGKTATPAAIHGLVAALVSELDHLKIRPDQQPYFVDGELNFRPIESKAARAEPTAHKMSEVWARWQVDQASRLAPSTIKRYAPAVLSFIAHNKDPDISSITGDMLYIWAEKRLEQGIKSHVINRNDLIALRSVFEWATRREGGRLITSNPVDGIKMPEDRAQPKRERSFRDSEISKILRAANAVDTSPRGRHAIARRAQRWCPWLAAYSGARISELTALRVVDIAIEQGVPVMHIRTSKTGLPRIVPLHPHLIDMGFVDFAKTVTEEYLFIEGAAKSTVTPPHELRSRKMAEWVRSIIDLDPGVDPNHGWRYTYKTRALDVMPPRISDAITGHAGTSVARKYEAPTIKMMYDAMCRYPRYMI